nr:MAG TPA: Rtr1/RPAP2 family [Caudoviricetes sp.]
MYIVKDNCGFPQCGNYDEYTFSEFWELEDF